MINTFDINMYTEAFEMGQSAYIMGEDVEESLNAYSNSYNSDGSLSFFGLAFCTGYLDAKQTHFIAYTEGYSAKTASIV